MSRRVATTCAALFFAAQICTAAPSAGSTVFESWNTENGLPQNSVNDILRTRDGYLWLATFGGLVRFDGVRFVVFDRSVPGIDSVRIFSLHEDRAGTLWAGTDSGTVIRYRAGVFTTFGHDQGLPQSGAHRIEEDDEGALLIHSLAGVTRYDGQRFIVLTPEHFDNRVRRPPATRYPDVWSWHDGNVFHALIKGRVQTYPIGDLIGDAKVTRVNVDRRGNLWINTSGDVVIKAAGHRLERLTSADGLPPTHTEGTWHEGTSGAVWFGDLHRAYRIRDGRAVSVHVPGMPASGLRSFYVDTEGSTWLGTTASGLHRLIDAPVTLHTELDGGSLRVAYALLRDRTGAIWMSTSGLHRYADGRLVSYRVADGTPARVSSLYEDATGTLWVGTDRGLSTVHKGRWIPQPDPSGYLRGVVWAILQDRTGTFWYATDAGLVSRSAGRVVKRYTVGDGLADTKVTALFEDRDGALWVGTASGLTRLANGTFRSYTAGDGFIGNNVRAMHQDVDGVLWVGTYDGGLYRLVGDRLTRFTRADGLHDNGVFQILEDESGYFWMGSNRGIQRVSRRELNDIAEGRRRTVTPLVIGARDGLASVEVNGGRQPSGLKTPDGALWFPTMAGVAVIDPAQARSAPGAPRALLEDVTVAGRAVDPRDTVRVQSDNVAIGVRYTAPTFARPESVRFRHRLVGLNDDWNEAGARREATFYGVPPGRYAFQVVAAAQGGEWAQDGASFEIEVLPPFWRTTWFLAVSVLATVALVVAGHWSRVRRLARLHALQEGFSQRLIESQERERERISGDLHDSLGQSLRMIRKLARASRAGSTGRGGGDVLTDIAGLAESTETEMTEIAYGLRPYQLDTLGLSKTIESMIRRNEQGGGIRFVTDIAPIDHVVPEDARIHVFRILQEAVSNVVEHSHATEARVVVAFGAGVLCLTVEDNGTGLAATDGDRVSQPLRGLGLMHMRERARIVGGRLHVQSIPGRGTTVTMTLGLEGAGHG